MGVTDVLAVPLHVFKSLRDQIDRSELKILPAVLLTT